MIYESAILRKKSVNEETELNEYFEQLENRFEYDTIAEATATVLSEQEENWNRFMKAVGIFELESVIEGVEIVYEGARLEALKNTLVKWFTSAKEKLAQLTKAFMDKVDSFVGKINAKALEGIKKMQVPSSFSYTGYTFKGLEETPKYNFTVIPDNAEAIMSNLDKYSKEQALEDLVGQKVADGGLQTVLKTKYYGSAKAVELTNISLETQFKYITGAKDMKAAAKKSYGAASKELDKIIKTVKKGVKAKTKEGKTDDSKLMNVIGQYYKAFANGATVVHSTYMQALGARSRQALSILMAANKVSRSYNKASKAAAKEAKKNPSGVKQLTNTSEGYVDTSAFLGAVEFI